MSENEVIPQATDPCADTCLPQVDQVQIMEIYDLLNTSIRSDLQADYDCKKINGATYADTWAKMMSPAIGHVMSAVTSILNKETAHDRAIKEAQVALYERQTLGFDDNLRQKLFETQMNSWAMMFSSGLLEEVPGVITSQEATVLYKEIIDGIGDGTSTTLPYFSQSLTASVLVAGDTTLNWGEVVGATGYVLYASSPDGQLAGYPDSTVTANGSAVISIPTPAIGITVIYTFEIRATDGTSYRSSTTTLSITGV